MPEVTLPWFLCTCVCAGVTEWSVWYVNEMLMHRTNQPGGGGGGDYPWVMSLQSDMSAELWRRRSDLFWGTQQDLMFPSSWGLRFLWKPRSPWQRLPDPVQETLPAQRIAHLCLLPRLRAHRRGSDKVHFRKPVILERPTAALQG